MAATPLADKDTVADLNLAPDCDDRRSTFEREPFEATVIVVDVLCPGGNHSAIGRVEDDQIGITSDRDGALTREQAKQFRGTRAQGVHKTMQVDPPAIDAIGIHETNALFDARHAIRNVREGIPAKKFLLVVKRAMVRAHSIDQPRCKALHSAG